MTKLQTPQKIPPIPSGRGKLRLVLTVIFRLLLLGVGGGLAFLAGVAFSHFSPAPSPEMPLVERFRRSTERLWNDRGQISPTPSLSTNAPNPTVQAEVREIQAQLQQLRDRTATLETQVFGQSQTNQPLETRLQQLEANAKAPQTVKAATASTKAKFVVTLPSDVLFVADNIALRPEQQAILENVATELKNYRGAAVRIAAHTDNLGDARANLDLSLQRAEAIKQSLAQALGEDYKWFVVGFGETRPFVANDTASNRQRNRRIEIAID